ncbi:MULTISPECIES: SDR family oxidoreductase [unclassified Saccharopolyspora]|uniref:SDR family NAD(P)-dependent oxidoreductase n=1 Tax=unclassified Saccharopolyspora TaxID=2646250 RepID=UPI001CD72C8D|nr:MULTISPECIES: SDR family NAD(P)-dependent oxidoreductase [unclassified Saccharopolyspora]MCA1186290.1 SDR family NAD(P)-dependent oxidoreductase [Saccharopolyspora sp. 6T]MCA1225786.1 SDR family NAD(P)-dependent oxidoreductase [Saccharopolyspora sp. 6M]MCA1280015.1 SDR family NAD(P)-dependent oxidoreductase [Saccharopolyspora sp. 7B]
MRWRSALVTGASSGIGAALALELGALGCDPVLVGRNRERLAAVARRSGGRALVADLADPDAVRRVAEVAADTDLLINNAGAGCAGPLPEMPEARVAELVALNLTAPLQLTRAALPGLVARGGQVGFVSSIAATGVRGEAVYSATKAGLRAFAASVAHEGVPVTTVFPGLVATRFFDRRGAPERRFPRPVPPERVARVLVRALEEDTAEVFVPSWLGLAARAQGALPATFHRLAHRFG